ncbi:MAG: protein kinase [Pirellulaceae bacterium]|nr:protein kinase [Pirellulaceae bacterium]
MTATPATPAKPPDSPAESDFAGRRLGDYQILRRLGRGGMAEVYLAEQQSLHRQVAIKILRQNLSGDDGYIRRFRHEAQAAAKLVHANIVQIFEVGCLDGVHYIAQEYVAGQNLKQLVTRLGHGLEAPQAVNVIRQVAAALHKAAEHNITHRDIKPENIMIAVSGDVKVADFGLARIAQPDQALNLTQVGVTMGTPLYMSPEQVEGKEVDPRSDIYSFGVTCYHMLAGRPPFDGETALAVAVQHLKTEPKRLEAIRPDLPEGLCRIVHKMLAKQPGERYQRAIDLLKDLRGLRIDGVDVDWAADLPGFGSGEWDAETSGRFAATQQLSQVLRSERTAPARWSARRIALLAAGFIVAGFVVGAAAAWTTRPQPLLKLASDQRPAIKKFETVREQYLFAQMSSHNQEEAWQAVARYFPPTGENSGENLRYSRLATKGLAAYYLSSNRLPDALALYERLAKVEPTERDFHLAGVAGQAVVYDRLGQDNKVVELLVELRASASPTIASRLGEYLRGELQKVIEKHPPQGE